MTFPADLWLPLRAIGAAATALIVVLACGSRTIAALRARQSGGQPIREDGPASHRITKAGTPTMGGVLISAAVAAATLTWTDIRNPYVWTVLATAGAFGAIGVTDDVLKLRARDGASGMRVRSRLVIELLIAAVAVTVLSRFMPDHVATSWLLPLYETPVPLGRTLFTVAGALVVTGAANALNLTDGLDGLSIVPTAVAAAFFGVVAYVVGGSGDASSADPYAVSELAVACGAVVGAGLGFLWFNAPPAMMFMGDTGSLALGAFLGAVAVAVKRELLLAIVGGIFVVEALSVIIQVASFRTRRRRVFAMAPIHHHFECHGCPESRIVVRAWIISVVLAAIGAAIMMLEEVG